jgi:flagellar basal-body rod protein FlgF
MRHPGRWGAGPDGSDEKGSGSVENALLIGLSRQVALARELDVVANNIANVETNGFKRRQTMFREFLMPMARSEGFAGQDQQISFVHDRGTSLSFTQGQMEPTGNPLDVAIEGNAVFVVQNGLGQDRYTRNGSFQINGRGELVTSDGHRVMSDQGPVTFTATERDVRIAGDGLITTSNGNRGRLRLARVENPNALVNEGQNLFSSAAPLPPATGTETRVMSGMVEKSNVRAVVEISRMMEINRAYQSATSLIQRTDELRRTAMNRLADAGSSQN